MMRSLNFWLKSGAELLRSQCSGGFKTVSGVSTLLPFIPTLGRAFVRTSTADYVEPSPSFSSNGAAKAKSCAIGDANDDTSALVAGATGPDGLSRIHQRNRRQLQQVGRGPQLLTHPCHPLIHPVHPASLAQTQGGSPSTCTRLAGAIARGRRSEHVRPSHLQQISNGRFETESRFQREREGGREGDWLN